MTYEPVVLACPICDTILVISVELLEYLILHEPEADGSFGGFNHFSLPHPEKMAIHMEDVAFPVALNREEKSICWIGYCTKCKCPRVCSITASELTALFESG